MLDLSLHLLDLLENCAHAGATRASIEVCEDPEKDLVTIAVSDNGRGMGSYERERAMDPFYSSRGKRTGLGLPMMAHAARMAGGTVSLQSTPGKGTVVRVAMGMSNLDRQPLGDLVATVVSFLAGNPHVNLVITYRGPVGRVFSFDVFAECPPYQRESLGQIGFLSLVEERLRAGLASAGFSPDGGGVAVEVHRGSGAGEEGGLG